ncbi:MAG: leucine-rich repeat protein [Candidatus Fimenecus sp.]
MKKMFCVLLSVIIICASFVMPSSAATFGGFTYEVVDGYAVITGYSGSSTTLTVPSVLNGASVIKIGEGAFRNNTKLQSVTVSEGISDIGAFAFDGCTSLSQITFPETVNHIGRKAVYNTAYYNDKSNWKIRDLSSSGGVDIGNGSGNIAWEDIIASELEYLYLGKNLIEIFCVGDYYVKMGTLVIADGAFKDCDGLNKVLIPDSVKTVGSNAFYGCTSLGKIILPNKAINIGENAFFNTGAYNNPDNWQENAFYIGTHLIKSLNTFETVVKDGTLYIDGGALGTVDAVIPACVTDISENAFTDTSSARIFGYADTYAQQYAAENSISFVNLDDLTEGDVNFDGVLNTADYAMLCSIATASSHLSFAAKINGDLNYDGAVDGFDAITLDLILHGMGPSTVLGDADGDGIVTCEDYLLIVDITNARAAVSDNIMLKRCDLNNDGAVDAFDAIALDLMLLQNS